MSEKDIIELNNKRAANRMRCWLYDNAPDIKPETPCIIHTSVGPILFAQVKGKSARRVLEELKQRKAA